MPSKPPPIKQDYYNENRERFDAETTALNKEELNNRCDHYLITEGQNIECKNCRAGWPGLARYIKVINGKTDN